MSTPKEDRTILEDAIEGSENTEVYFGASTQLSVKAFRGQVASFTVSESAGASSRVIDDGRVGSAYTERVTSDDIKETIAQARTNAAYPEADEGNRLYEIASEEAFDARKTDLESVTAERKREIALAIERASLDADAKIVNVPAAMYGESSGRSILVNSFGVAQEYAYSYCYAYSYVMAQDGDETHVGSYVMVGNSFDSLDADAIAGHATQRAIDRLGSVEPESGEYRLVIQEEAASALLGAFVASGASPFYGENIQKGRSRLKGKIGETIGSEPFTIVDDPSTGLAPQPFDDEGVQTAKLALVEQGVFKNEVHNIYSATRGGGASTGHGHRGGYRGGISTSLHNPYLENGSVSLDELIAEAGSGILVTDVEGLHAGLNPVSGDFSLSAKGFRIEDGKRSYPLKNMVVAGNFYELAMKVVAKAGDRTLLPYQDFSSPSILLEGMSVSGK